MERKGPHPRNEIRKRIEPGPTSQIERKSQTEELLQWEKKSIRDFAVQAKTQIPEKIGRQGEEFQEENDNVHDKTEKEFAWDSETDQEWERDDFHSEY